MTLSTTDRLVVYTGNSSTTVFAYAFEIPDKASATVELWTASTDILFQTLSASQFSIDGLGSPSGGNVTYPVTGLPLTSAHKIVIKRTVPYTQDTDINNQGGFNADVLEDALDDIVLQVQQVAEETARGLRIAPTLPAGDEEDLASALLVLAPIASTLVTLTQAIIDGALLPANNLSDVVNAVTAGINLGFGFDTKAALEAKTFTSVPNHVTIAGYTAAGDGGGALYKKVGAQPSHNGRIQSADNTWWELAELEPNVLMLGAVNDGTGDQGTKFNDAIAYLGTKGGLVRVPAGDYLITTQIVLDENITLLGEGRDPTVGAGAGATRVTTTALGLDMFSMEAAGCQIENIEIAGTAARDAGRDNGVAIKIGKVFETTNLANMTSASKTLVITDGGLTGREGQRVRVSGAGVPTSSLRTTIDTVTNDTTVELDTAAGATVVDVEAKFGEFMDGCVVHNCNLTSHSHGVHLINAVKAVISQNRINCFDAIRVECLLSGDNGEHMIFDNRLHSDPTDGRNIHWTSGGGLRIHNNKFLNSKWDIWIDWNYDGSGGPQIVQNHFENGDGFLRVTGNGNAFQQNWNIAANTFNGSSNGILFTDDDGTGWVKNLVISSGNLFKGGPPRLIDIGKAVESFHISGNVFDGQSAANVIGVDVRSGATGGYITTSNMFRNYDGTGAVPVRNADASTRVEVSHHNDFVTGTAGVGVSYLEEGVGHHHLTKLTLSSVLPPLAGGAQCKGFLVYTLPAGVCVVNSIHMDVRITQTEGFINNDTPFVGIGTVIGTGAVADLTGTAGFDDYVSQKAANNCIGTKTDKTEIPATDAIKLVSAGDVHAIHFNAADTWDAGGDAAAILGGEVWISWDYLGV